MKKIAVILTTLFILLLLGTPYLINLKLARANPDYVIEQVDHEVKVMYNGFVIINDTITISGETSEPFLLNLPQEYGQNILDALAYSPLDSSVKFPIELDVPLTDRVGFYGIQINFPQGNPQIFSLTLVLSNALVTQDAQDTTQFTLNFPAFPGLTKNVGIFNGSIALPAGAQFLKGDGVWTNLRTSESEFAYNETDLVPFTYDVSGVTFSLSNNEIQLFEIKQLTREIGITEIGQIGISDSYYFVNEGTSTIESADVFLPSNASSINAQDQLGSPLKSPTLVDANASRYTVTFNIAIDVNKSGIIILNYNLPNEIYIQNPSVNEFLFNISLFQNIEYYIDQTTIGFSLPEGARLRSFEETSGTGSYNIQRGVFQETANVVKNGVTSLETFNVALDYEYNSLWLAFRPTIWVWALAIVGSLILIAWRRPKGPGQAVPLQLGAMKVKLLPEDVRAFVDSYEEKMKITSEIESLESKAQKGRIPRRRYKVQKKTFETRLGTLGRSLEESKQRIRSSGGHYADLMRQLEVAESEINDVDVNLKNIEARYGRSEISLEAYRERLADYQRRKEKAQSTIKGILLRLREETG